MVDTLWFIPCCKRKTATPDRRSTVPTLTAERLPETWPRLQAGRKGMNTCIDANVLPCIALRQYDGGFYKAEASFREDITYGLSVGQLDLYIFSAGYGIVHPLDPIRPYEAEMKSSVASHWKDAGLSAVIAELIRNSHARRVLGFFAGPAHWSGNHAKYRYFFTKGVAAAVAQGAELDTTACFHRASGQGARAINGALGRALLHGVRSDFSSGFFGEYAAGRRDGTVVIRSENLLASR